MKRLLQKSASSLVLPLSSLLGYAAIAAARSKAKAMGLLGFGQAAVDDAGDKV